MNPAPTPRTDALTEQIMQHVDGWFTLRCSGENCLTTIVDVFTDMRRDLESPTGDMATGVKAIISAALAAKDAEIERLKSGAVSAFVDMSLRAEKAEAELAEARQIIRDHDAFSWRKAQERDALRAEVERLKAHEGDLVIGSAILNGARQQEAESVDQLRARLGTAEATLAAAQQDKERLVKALERITATRPTHGINPQARMDDPPEVKIGWNVHQIARAAIDAARSHLPESGMDQP